jgi:HSP20 family protein
MTRLIVPRRAAAPVRRAHPLGWGRELDRVLDEVWRGFGFPVSRVAEPGAFTPRMDVSETEEAFRIDAELPGLEEKDIEVSIEDGVLTLKGERAEEKEEKDDPKGWHRRETFRGKFQRAVRLPESVDRDAVSASYRAGVLTLTLPKLPEARPEVKTVPITTS